ncbi:citrate lyase subunit beta/citryl-CoA lyase [Pseudorhizobium tarimense]|uniref:Citrate lyase subunit beta/citryl-CoA lyase n=1 Tax=Pseudorhizobium tarimense TaxID=1079109 RepID=A0ABV2H859_9HYPH|nr:CoA ester lyase [Pseudorhizobium tarimense]MCJ8519857.1 CoA ester lyase [Pseudorhizobium tarimense]
MTTVSSPTSHSARIRRSCLSVPAINQRALDKTHGLDCDVVIFDLEDSVFPEKKGEARDNLRRFFRQTPLEGREAVIRTNAIGSEFQRADIDLVLELAPDAVLLPKVDGPQDIREAADLAAASPGVRLWAMMETAKGVLNAAAIAAADARLDCLVLGLNDLRKDTGVPSEHGRTYLVPWIMQVVLAARAHGLDVIDSVFNDFWDTDGFAAECSQGRAMGFDGKMLIHPAQIEGANQAFSPSAEAIAEAEAIVTAFADPAARDLNVINMNGQMVERLHLEQAERLLAKTRHLTNRKTTA